VGDSRLPLDALRKFRDNISDFNRCWSAVDHEKGRSLLAKRVADRLDLWFK